MSGGTELKSEVLDTSLCTLCGACLDWCPYLKNLEDNLVMPFACNVGDGRCYSICPRTFTDWQKIKAAFLPNVPNSVELGAFTAIYKVKATNSIDKQQDGGTVTSLIKTALQEDLAQAALLTGADDNITPYAFWGFTAEDVAQAAGSRFLAAPGLRKLTAAAQNGIKKMLVVGRPCQIQALRKYQMHPESEQLDIVSIGLFCMWSLSWGFKDYFHKSFPDLNINRISIPQHGVEIATDEGIKVLTTDKVKEFVRPACNYCLDMTSELADISVGAFEAESGWNTVIIRTQKGAALLQSAADKGYLTVQDYPQQDLQGLKRASLNKKARNLKNLQEVVNNQQVKSFVDLTNEEYIEIIAAAEGTVNS